MTRFIRLLAVPFLLLLAACAGMPTEPVDVSLVNMSFEDAALFEQRVTLELRLRNPNDTALSVDGLRYALNINGQPFASGMGELSVTVPRLGETTVRVPGSVGTLDLVRQITAIPGTTAVAVDLTGTVFLSPVGRLSFVKHDRVDLSTLGLGQM